jgi:uncharacterized protein (TIGR03067 family)
MRKVYAIVLASLLGGAVGVAQQPDRPPQPGTQPGAGDKAASLDGQWTVVSCAKDGAPVDKSDKLTVTIKGNEVTFAGGDDKTQMRALRLDFGPNGTLRVTEAGTDGKFDTTRPGGQPAAQPGGSDQKGPLTGVYVLTPDYLAVCVNKSTAPGDKPGGTGDKPGGQAGTTAGSPEMKSHMSVILKRATGGNRDK